MNHPLLIKPARFADERGWFSETYSRCALAERGIACEFVQDNHSMSRAAYVLRGLHFQAPPNGQHKLVRCVRGRIYDVAVDVRVGSPTYGEHIGAELNAENGHQLYVPIGYAHGFLTLEPDCEVVYKCSDYYAPHSDGGVRWDTAEIAWPMPPGVVPQLSDKDRDQPPLAVFASPFLYDGQPLTPIEA